MAEEAKGTMTYRYLGNTGLKVSVLSFGTMLTNYYEEDKKNWLECAKACYDAGINYFDSAEIYGMGDGDRLLGQAIKENEWSRDTLIISVKVVYGGPGPNDYGMSRKHIIEGTKASLKRIGIDYCDLLFSHRPSSYINLEETCRAFSWLVQKGYAKYWATSCWTAEMIAEAIEICEDLGLYKPIADQAQYNMIYRHEIEADYRRIYDRYGYGTTVWSPLGMGLLSGKYNDGDIPEDSRFGKSAAFKSFTWPSNMNENVLEERKKMFKGLKEIADGLG
mmetsp:Transcript_17443/g.15376  ORF Transcript_17443/g.15376 Transcript_17443/m.15376 type:complete len:277 (+) Transcript_17443:7-837(+)